MKPPLLEAPASIFLVMFVQAFLLLCLFGSVIFEVLDLAFFSITLMAIALSSRIWSRMSGKCFTCKMALSRTRLFPGERLEIGFAIANAKWIPILHRIDMFIPGAVAGSQTGEWIREENGLLWFQKSVFSRHFNPGRRGVFDLGPPNIKCGDIFGFFFHPLTLKERLELIVYPRIVNIRPIAVPKRELFGIPGARNPVEDPVFIFGTREYMPGRPARSIHWKASARHNRLQEKLCEPAQHEKVLLLLDTDGFDEEDSGEDFERTLEVIASLLLHLSDQGIAVGFATNGHILGGGPCIIPVSASARQMTVILETLARAEAKNGAIALTEVLTRGYTIPWGVSGLIFARDRSRSTRATRAYMKNRNAPVQTVMARKSNGVERAGGTSEANILYLEDILIPGGSMK